MAIKRSAFTGNNKSKSGGVSGGGSTSTSSTKTSGVLGGSSTATASTQSGTRTKTSTQQSGGTPVVPTTPASVAPKPTYTGAGASNLSQYYSGKGSQLGRSVSQRFADPEFASAAQRAGISQQQYQINPGNAKYNQSILAQLKAGGTTQANPLVETVQNNTTTTPTVGEVLQTAESTQPQYDNVSYEFGADPMAGVLGYYKSLADQKVDEDKIRRDILSQFQGRINATNQVYDQLLSQARKVGQGEVGAGTALLAARGLAGSARGQAIAGGIEQQNLEREQGVEAQRLQQIEEIQNQAYALAQQAVADKQAAKDAGYDKYVEHLGKDREIKAGMRNNFVASLIYSGKDINNLNPQQLRDIAKQLGSSADEIRTTYDILKAQQEAKTAEDQAFTLSEGQARYVLDPETGEYTQVAQRGKTYKGGSGGGSGGGGGVSGGTLEGLYSMLGKTTANAVIAQADKFGNNPIVQKYNDFIGVANVILGVDPNTQNPADHQAVIYNFAKALDPDSVVREGEYATIQKYSQAIGKKYGGQIKQAISGKGFLSPEAIKSMQTSTKNRVQAYSPQYNNLKSQTATRINRIAGQEGIADIVLLDYETGLATPTDSTTTQPTTTTGFSVKAPNGKTYSFKTQAELNTFKAKAGI